MGYLLTEDYVLEENKALIQKWCQEYGRGLEQEDRFWIANAAFLQAMRTWQKGRSRFHEYAEETVRAFLEEERGKRNGIMRVESPFSLDQPIRGDENNQRSFTMYAQQTGDFVNGVVFRDFLKTLPPALGKTASRLIREYLPDEIRSIDGLSEKDLDCHIALLQQWWKQYNIEAEQAA